ncbi:5446_t:CDS:2, partial [Cetraspora pellucida]
NINENSENTCKIGTMSSMSSNGYDKDQFGSFFISNTSKHARVERNDEVIITDYNDLELDKIDKGKLSKENEGKEYVGRSLHSVLRSFKPEADNIDNKE